MTATPYKIYVVFKNMSVEGKYIPLLYTANDVVDANAVLPSDSTTYTFPSGTDANNKEEYRLVEAVVIGTFTDTSIVNIWVNDQKTEHFIVNAINTRETVERQFKTIELFFKEGSSFRLKLGN